jgi:hypothetical protein
LLGIVLGYAVRVTVQAERHAHGRRQPPRTCCRCPRGLALARFIGGPRILCACDSQTKGDTHVSPNNPHQPNGGAALLLALLGRFTRRPDPIFLAIAELFLLVSFYPDWALPMMVWGRARS